MITHVLHAINRISTMRDIQGRGNDQKSLVFVVGLLISLVLVRHIILKMAPHIVFSGYLFMFVIGVMIAYIATQSFHTSLFVGLALVYGRIVYRYSQPKEVLNNYTGWQNTTIFIVGIIAAYVSSLSIQPYADEGWFHIVLFVMVLYLAASMLEWILHRKIMHCYMYWKGLEKMDTSNNWLMHQLQKSCHLHKDHHLSVKTDMSLKEVKDDHELIFDWLTTFGAGIIGYPFILLITYVLRIRVSWCVQFVAILLMTVIFSLVWNSIHATMHGAQVHVPLTEGPPNMDVKLDKDALYAKNHIMHHQIKGEEKGNYNVVFLGADELFMTNRMG